MALIPKLSSCQPSDCKKMQLWDTTGAYDASTNPGGFGAPNIASTAVTQFILKIYPPGYAVPIIFTYTVVTGTITACSRTDPDGTVTVVTTLISDTTYPFDVDNKQVFTSDLLNIGEDVSLDSGNWFFEYILTDGTLTYNTSEDTFFFCVLQCCVRKMLLAITTGNCDCNDGAAAAYRNAKTYLESAQFNAQWGNKELAQAAFEEAEKLCNSNCQGC